MQLEPVREWVANWGPLAVGVGSTFDNTGVPIFFVVGMAVAHEVGVPPETMLVAAFVGSVVGDLVVYTIGRYFLTKDRIAAGRIGQRFKPILDAGQRTVHRWGFLSVLLGRFIPYVGKVTPFLAGSYNMSWPGAVISVGVGSAMLMGLYYYYANTAFNILEGEGNLLKFISIGALTVLVVLLWWANRRLEKRSKAGTDPSP